MNACLTFYVNTLLVLYIMLWHFMNTYFSSVVIAQLFNLVKNVA